ADLCEQHGLQVPVTSPQTVERLKPHAPDIASLGNPIDLTPQGYADGFASYNRLIAEMLAAGEFDQAIVRSAPGTVATVWAEGFVKVAAASDKPMVVTWGSGSERSQDAAAILERAALPCFLSPRRAVRALGAMHDFALKLERHRRRASGGFARPLPPQALDIAPGARALGEHRSKSLLAAYGVPVTREVLLSPEAVGALTEAPLAFPLAVKIESADLPHKTEAGAVKLGVADLAGLKQAAQDVTESARRFAPQARIDGILIQQMASGTEAIVGAVDDPHFGPTVLFGLGGILSEVLHDVTHRFAPFDLDTAREMVREIRAAALFDGYRGKPALDVEALADALMRVSLLIADHAGAIREIDINPLFVRPVGQGVLAADALIVLHEPTVRPDPS
ncbi:MAG TPA: acetate--CoA ligase family protein, partial [Burkholderiales bacterium]|nr:acetate--CoA ligase family protein [Burkholderiales bacterium]